MPRVFIINAPSQKAYSRAGNAYQQYDISPAEKYGEVIFVFHAKSPRPTADPQAAVEHARHILQDIDEEDYIIWAGGDPFGAIIVAAVAADYLDGRIQYLKFQRERVTPDGRRQPGYYEPMVVEMFEGETND